jgi:hypothetical protein
MFRVPRNDKKNERKMKILNPEEEYSFRKKIRNIIKTRLKNIKYSPSEDDIYKPTKLHNDIIIGPGMSGGQNLSPTPSGNRI